MTTLEEGAQGIQAGDLEDGGLQDQIGHWVKVLNRWVSDLDRGLGRQDGDGHSHLPVDEIGADP